MSEVESGSISFILTSPANETILNRAILGELVRVLSEDGVLALNMGGPVTTWEISQSEILRPYHIAERVTEMTSRSLILRYDLIFAYEAEHVSQMVSGLNDKGGHELALGFFHVHEHVFLYSKPNRLALQNLLRLDKLIPSTFILPASSFNSILDAKKTEYMPTPFNELMVQVLLQVFSQANDTVLDPMAGWGTLGKVAAKMQRNCVLYEFDPLIFRTGFDTLHSLGTL